jgi:hypothetical protein
VITRAHAQALIAPGQLIHEAEEDLHYLRMDFERSNLGGLLHDPVPHVHAQAKGEPRFALSDSRSLPHVDFVELVLRNYFHDEWEDWADRVWERRVKPVLPFDGTADPRTQIKAAFRESHYPTLMGDFRESVSQWKRVLVEEKRRMCPLAWDETHEVLGY